jgi:thiamine-monophosphate kinase
MACDELEFVAWLRERQRAHPAVSLGIGDDMAVVHAKAVMRPGRILISSDMLLDGVHFDTKLHSLAGIGRKAVACGLSDCAAMAVKPVAATVSVAFPKDPYAPATLAGAKELFEGMFTIAAEYDLALAGGDTTRWEHPLVIDVAITASPYEGVEPVTRVGAKPGDTLYVTGQLGGSLLGRHLAFTPRVHEARELAQRLGDRLHAMMDISDGLSLDLWRMCQASNVGATLDERQLEAVISDDARRAAAADGPDGPGPLERALGDGEDFELLLAAVGDVSDVPVTVYPVGEVTSADLRLRHGNGRIDPLEPKGFVH